MTPGPFQSPKRTLTEILRDRAAGLIDPAVSVLARLGVSPNALTLAGTLAHFLFAWLIATGRLQLAGLAIALISPLDALDGALARKIHQEQSKFGAFLDSTADRLAEIILFAGYILYFAERDNAWLVAASYLALTGSLMVSYTRSRAGALGISCEVGLLTRVERYLLIMLTLILRQPEIGIVILALFTYVTFGQRVYHVWRQVKNVRSGP